MIFLKYMKRSSVKKLCFIVFLQLCLMLFIISTDADAAIFNVSSQNELEKALSAAAANGEDDTIRIRMGYYSSDHACLYESSENFGLTIEGGYLNNFTERNSDPANTILYSILLSASTGVRFEIDGVSTQLRVTNGDKITYEGDPFLTSAGEGHAGTIRVSNCILKPIFISNSGKVVLSNNIVQGYMGIVVNSCYSVQFFDNTVEKTGSCNRIGCGGGGVHVNYAFDVVMAGNYISDNIGIGADISSYKVLLLNNVIKGNTPIVSIDGGGVKIISVFADLENNTVSGNTISPYGNDGSLHGGGGAYIDSYSLYMKNNMIRGNHIKANSSQYQGIDCLLASYNPSTFVLPGILIPYNQYDYNQVYNFFINKEEKPCLFYSSDEGKIQWGCRGEDNSYCVNIFDSDWNMIHEDAACGTGLHHYDPDRLELTQGNYHWKVKSSSGYGGEGFEGDFTIENRNCGFEYRSDYESLQWGCRGEDTFYCVDVFDSGWNMIKRAAACGEGLHSYNPEELNLVQGSYRWRIWSPGGYGGDGLEGLFTVDKEDGCGLPYQSNYEKIEWGCRGEDTFYCLDIFDSDWHMIHQAVACGEGLHSYSPVELDLATGIYHWKVWSPSGYGGERFQGAFMVDQNVGL